MSTNKDEEIKLYLSAITTRDPSKRQIKPVDKDAFQLFDDIESESDEDFVIGSDELSDVDQQNESEENNSSEDEQENENNEDSENSAESSNKSNALSEKFEKSLKQDELDPHCNDIKYVSKTKVDNVMICMMCLTDKTFTDNEIVECDGCGIVVHEDCYKISDSIFMSCDSSDTSTDPWFCDACLTNVQNPMCELCPAEGGVFKRTENNRWVHLLCALYTPGVAFNDIENLCEITLSELPLKDWSARECSLCSNPFFSKTGIAISCDAGLCKNVFHVTCAQKEGLLSEPNNEENSDDPYFANCRQHTDKEVVKRRRKNWNAAVNRQKLRLEEWDTSDHYNDSRLIRKREFFSSMYCKSLDMAPPPFVPITKVPCFLETNPVAVALFKKKATNLRLPQEMLTSQTSTETKMITSGIPVFGPDFISYFLDREKKIDETTSEIVRLEGLHRELQISEQNTSHQFNKTVAKKNAIAKVYKTSLEELQEKCEIIKQLVKNRELADILTMLLNKFELVTNYGFGNGNGNESVRSAGGDRNGNCQNKAGAKGNSVINECYLCKSVSDQHLLIDCDNCHKFIHIGCLDPPLTRMPRKTKLYGWQCSLCVSDSTDEEQKKTVDVDRPRQLRKSSVLRSKYGRPEEISSAKKFSQRLLKKTKQRTILKSRILSKSMKDKTEKKSRLSRDTKAASVISEIPILFPERPVIEIIDCNSLLNPEMLGVTVPPLAQRKSDRPRKRPLTLLDEYETTPGKIKRPKFPKVLRSIRRHKKSFTRRGRPPLSRMYPMVTLTAMSKQRTSEPDFKVTKQPITFYPSSFTSLSSKNSTESERVQIGVVAKKPPSLLRDGISTSLKSVEKKSILIKCHDEHDDDKVSVMSGLGSI